MSLSLLLASRDERPLLQNLLQAPAFPGAERRRAVWAKAASRAFDRLRGPWDAAAWRGDPGATARFWRRAIG